MDRRELFGALGAVGAGLGVGNAALPAEDHGAARNNARFLAPVSGLHAHFCGIHIAKNNPKFQIVAQHYCAAHGEDMHQCLLYESCARNAKLLGVEYIITDKLYRGLPDEEKKYWHPHTYEVLAGGLIAPSMTPEDEMKFMKAILTTWGKTWHTWPDPSTPVPLGEPLLMWAVTGDGQLEDKVVAARDKQFGVTTATIRAERGKEIGLHVPNVALPKSIDQVGRQWTDDGEDKPRRRE